MNITKKLLFLTMPFLFLGQTHAQDAPNIEFGGRIQADATYYNNDVFKYQDGSEVRRARLFIRGDLTEHWDYKLQYDFAPDDPESKDIYIRYNGFDNTRITLGNFKVFGGLEELTSSNNMSFTERGLPNALVKGRRVGVGYQNWSEAYSIAIAAYGHEANNLARGRGVSARFAYRPNLGEGKLLHLGLHIARDNDDGSTTRLRTRPETHQDSHRIIDTGTLVDVDQRTTLGFEVSYVNGRFSAQSEVTNQQVKRKFSPDFNADGGYIYASYFLTDDSRPYSNSNAAFTTVRPSSDKGAWEIAARFSTLDLNDGPIRGGKVDSMTLGVNYYMSSDLRFSANYVMAEGETLADTDEPGALQLRLRYSF